MIITFSFACHCSLRIIDRTLLNCAISTWIVYTSSQEHLFFAFIFFDSPGRTNVLVCVGFFLSIYRFVFWLGFVPTDLSCRMFAFSLYLSHRFSSLSRMPSFLVVFSSDISTLLWTTEFFFSDLSSSPSLWLSAPYATRTLSFVTSADTPQFRGGNPYFFSENPYQSVSFIYASTYRENVHAIHIAMQFAKKSRHCVI